MNVTDTLGTAKVCVCNKRSQHVAGEAKWPCLWTGCDQKFRRWELRKSHVERDHHAGDMKAFNPKLVARQDEVFVYMVRKSIRGQREQKRSVFV